MKKNYKTLWHENTRKYRAARFCSSSSSFSTRLFRFFPFSVKIILLNSEMLKTALRCTRTTVCHPFDFSSFHSRLQVPLLCRSLSMSSPLSSPASTSEAVNPNAEVLFSGSGSKRIITLNRPKALNALNLNMVREIYPKLKVFQEIRSPLLEMLFAELGRFIRCEFGAH